MDPPLHKGSKQCSCNVFTISRLYSSFAKTLYYPLSLHIRDVNTTCTYYWTISILFYQMRYFIKRSRTRTQNLRKINKKFTLIKIHCISWKVIFDFKYDNSFLQSSEIMKNCKTEVQNYSYHIKHFWSQIQGFLFLHKTLCSDSFLIWQ